MMQNIAELPSHPTRAKTVDGRAKRKTAVLPRVVANLRKIHLWLGILLSPFIVVIAATGIAINHFGGGIMKKLHSGKALGTLGRVTVDLVALGLILLLISGLFLWLGPKMIKARKHRAQEI